ncbi:MAG: RNA polymerase sigma factor [Bacteroidales bacterium]|nr:RNA polymerase sigma factor [Bacteroidales bacterium]MCF8387765.1 RNA polymerase sigma factor [Bacteroidales bacterium]MCF8399429.1 RNA polymerase sigma factor [Bacteroidales bacterium]
MAFREDQYYIERIKDGETSAFSELVEKHKDWVYTIVIRILRSHEEAEETAQDVFLKAYNSLKTFQGKSKFSTWLYSIAYNTAITKTRKRKLKTSDLDDEIIYNYSEDEISKSMYELSPEEQQQSLRKAMNDLPEEENLLITLFYKKENSIAEISEITGMSSSNVKVKLHRIRKKLYEKLRIINKIENQEKAF